MRLLFMIIVCSLCFPQGLPGARSAEKEGEIFLGGNYIELGIHSTGSFGTYGNKPALFLGTVNNGRLGMSNDADGYNVGEDLRIDYFLPGTPEERWLLGYTIGTTQYSGSNSGLMNSNEITVTDLSNTSSGDSLSAEMNGT